MAFSMLLSACNIIDGERVKGNGRITTATLQLKDFTKISIHDNMTLILKQAAQFAVKVETDENIQPYILAKIEDGNRLIISYKNDFGIHTSKKTKVYVSAPWLDEVDINNASELKTDGKFSQNKKIDIDLSEASSAQISLRAPAISLKASEASSLIAEGECRDVKLRASEASTIKAFELKAENGEVRASEASSVQAFSSIALQAKASEASSVKYKGNPTTTANSSEASSISKAE